MLGLRPQEDALGQALLAQYNGEDVDELIERDDGFIDLTGGPRFYLAPYRAWPAFEKRALRHARGRVLDVGCGAGRHALYLQERGHSVLGIDISPLAVRTARLRGLRQARVLPITRVSRSLGQFDTVLLLGNNFGLLANVQRARWLLRRFKGMMPDTGVIIASSADVYQTDDKSHLAYQRQNRRRGRMSGQIRIRVRYRDYASPYFDYLLVSREEMERIVAGTGWAISRCYDDTSSPRYAAILVRERE